MNDALPMDEDMEQEHGRSRPYGVETRNCVVAGTNTVTFDWPSNSTSKWLLVLHHCRRAR